ncbi:MAG: 7-cyano-7-deazaguanine synthase, partial [Gammaproteobacteria bacterium]
MKKAVIALSGGLDSTTCLAIAKAQGFSCYAMTFDYGQRNDAELVAAKRVAQALGVVEHKIFAIDIAQFGHSALTDMSLDLPTEIGLGIPITYVP